MKLARLLTGKPGVGKTTLIKQALEETGIEAGGFYTEEIRQAGVRQGFRIVTVDGRTAVLARAGLRSRHAVSRYGVDTETLDGVGVPAVNDAIASGKVVVIDEIGKMELFSPAFRDAVTRALDGGKPMLGTIMLAPHPWADTVKRRPDVETVVVTRENRQQVLAGLKSWLNSIMKEERNEQDTGTDQT